MWWTDQYKDWGTSIVPQFLLLIKKMILDTIQNLSLIMTDFQLRFFWFAYLSTMSKASFPLFILILLFLLKCGNIFTYWAPEAAVFLSSKNMNLHFTFKLMWQLQLLRFHLWDQHLSSKRNFIIYQNALETLEPAVNHQRAAHVGSSDHFPPRDDDAGVGQLLLPDDRLVNGSSHLRKRLSRFTNRRYLDKLFTYWESK